MASKNKEVAVAPSPETLAALSSNIPAEPGYTENQLPRINFVAKDVTEEVKGKDGKKKINIITEAGTFVLETYDEVAKEFKKKELGTEIDLIFVYERKQLKYYDESTNSYVSSPIYDNESDIIPLFKDKKVIARGIASELQKDPKYVQVKDGKQRFLLEEQKVTYVLYSGEMHQLTIRGSSAWMFSKYKKSVSIPTVVTTIDSTPEQNGSNYFNKMRFTIARDITGSEAEEVLGYQTEIKNGIAERNAYFAKFKNEDEEEDWSSDEETAKGKFEVKGEGMDPKHLPSGKDNTF